MGNDSGPRAAQCESILPALLGDGDPRVLRAALAAAERVRLPATWPAIIPALAQHSTGPLAVCALAAGREDVLPFLQAACLEPDQDPRILAGIALVCGRIGGPQAIAILEPFLDHADADVRRQALLGLSRCAYQATPQERGSVKERFRAQAARLAEIVAAQVDVGDAQEVLLTADVLEQRRQMGTDNLLLLLSFLDEPQTVLSAREALQPGRFDDEKRAYALEALDILLDHETKALLFPFVKQLEPGQRLAAAHKELPQTLLGRKQRLYTLLQAGEHQSGRWTRVCAIYGLGLLEHAAAEVVVDTAVRFDEDPLLLETALNSLEQHGVSLEEIAAANPALEQAVRCWRGRDPRAMTLLQKAQILKQGSIFAGLPHKALESIAGLMGVIDIDADETIIHKGDPGDSMYVIVEGQLRVHENGRTFDTLGAGGVVGEMALLDAGPRSASVTGVVGGGRLLRLDREPFLDLLAGNPQMARELLGLMSRRLRERTADLAHESDVQNPQPIVRNMPVAGGRPGMWGGAVAQGELMDLNKLFILKCTEFFGRINSDLLERIAVLLEEVDLAGGEALFEEGDPGRSLYIVAAGQVRVHVEGRTLAYAGEGEVLGEMALLDSAPRSASVTGTVPAQLLRLDQRPFFELLEAQPELARGIIKMLSGRLRKRLLELGRLTENGTILPIA